MGVQTAVFCIVAFVATLTILYKMLPVILLTGLLEVVPAFALKSPVDAEYHAPPATPVNSLASVLNTTGVYGFIYNTSQTPGAYSTYNWCNMPAVRIQEYPKPPFDYQLTYAEVIQRHHKRTPYASNTFPTEIGQWDCTDTRLFTYAEPRPYKNTSSAVYARYYQSEINPFRPYGFKPFDCQFPQITAAGLQDSFQHGQNLFAVYHDLLGLIDGPTSTRFRVTNNVITSQVAGSLIAGMFGAQRAAELSIQSPDVDSLEPKYSCPSASNLLSSYASGSWDPHWQEHLTKTKDLSSRLDAISGIDPSDDAWHVSFDHYYDNLSARLCHQKPLPCNSTFSPQRCVSDNDADAVFRLGQYEYAYTWRSAGNQTIIAAAPAFGIWVAELAANLQATAKTTRSKSRNKESSVTFRHNTAHDGSISRLLSILQLSDMVWPGLGSEVVFELWRKSSSGKFYVRILWGGQPLQSSNPTLQAKDDMIQLNRFIAYVEALVGQGARDVPALCGR